MLSKKKKEPQKGRAAGSQKERMAKAKKNLEQIEQELARFPMKRRITRATTKGEWCNSSCLVGFKP